MLETPISNYQARRIALKNPEHRNVQGGKRVTTKQNATRGRCIGSAREEFSQKVHVLDSVKSQALSGEDFTQGIADENIRYQTFVRRAGTLIVFLVDSSGSMLAQKRIEMAKGCVMSLLKDAYINRDKVAMITFGGKDAQVVLPPTASQEQASQMLKKIKTGGKTPMIDAFNKAAILTEKIVDMPILYVLVSDGRYSRMDCADPDTKIKNFGVFCQTKKGKILVVDAEEKSIFALCTAKKLADELQATYVKIDDMRDDVLLNTVGKTLYVS